MIVEDVMSANPVSVNAGEFVTRAREIMREYDFKSLPVLDHNRKVLGLITVQDIIHVTSSRSNVTVDGFIRNEIPVVPNTMNLVEAADIVANTSEGRVPVVDNNGRLSGLLSINDLFDALGELEPSDEPVSRFMTTDVITCSPDDNVSRVWLNMLERDITGFPVVRKKEVIGMVTREDIIRKGYARIERESERGHMTSTTVQKIMSTPAITINEDDSMKKAALLFKERNIGRVPVLRDGKLAGIVDRHDVIKSCKKVMMH